jgi:hypothetical protein
MLKRGTLAGLAAVTLAAAGCGSSGPSVAAFTAKANSICSSFEAASTKNSQTGVAGLKSEEKLLSDTFTKLAAVTPPSDKATAFKSFVAEGREVVSQLDQLISAVAAHDAKKVASFEALVPRLESAGHTKALAAGLKGCD